MGYLIPDSKLENLKKYKYSAIDKWANSLPASDVHETPGLEGWHRTEIGAGSQVMHLLGGCQEDVIVL